MSQMSFLENTTVEAEYRHTRHMLWVMLNKAQDRDWSQTELHKQVAELQNGMDAMHNKLDALLALLSGDQAALKAMVVQGAVVPNEDEAAPIVSEELPPLATCPVCAKSADSQEKVEEHFGYRTMEDGKVRVQSWCRGCRALGVQTQPGKRERLPDDVRSLGQKARELYRQADQVAASRAAALEASKGRETRESVVQLTIEQDLRQKAVELMAEYDKARGLIRKSKKTAST